VARAPPSAASARSPGRKRQLSWAVSALSGAGGWYSLDGSEWLGTPRAGARWRGQHVLPKSFVNPRGGALRIASLTLAG
jgi:hypothetical protein